jgi:hypothetical protein
VLGQKPQLQHPKKTEKNVTSPCSPHVLHLVSDVGANSEVGAGVGKIVAIYVVSTGVTGMYFIL